MSVIDYSEPINTIRRVKCVTGYCAPDQYGKITDRYVVEVEKYGVTDYHIVEGSRKHLHKRRFPVDPEETFWFFDEIYDFIRNADYEENYIDDCARRILIDYSGTHREAFDSDVSRDEMSLQDLIYGFFEKQAEAAKQAAEP